MDRHEPGRSWHETGWMDLHAQRRDRSRDCAREASVRSGSCSGTAVECSPTQASNEQASATGPKTEATKIQLARNDYAFEDVQFARNRFNIAPDESRKLDEAANVLKGDSLLRLSIEGYTCSLGTAQYNLALGNRRATAVKEYLVGQGVPADRLQTISFGEERANMRQLARRDSQTESPRRPRSQHRTVGQQAPGLSP